MGYLIHVTLLVEVTRLWSMELNLIVAVETITRYSTVPSLPWTVCAHPSGQRGIIIHSAEQHEEEGKRGTTFNLIWIFLHIVVSLSMASESW